MRRSFPLFRTKILMTTLTFAVMFPGEVRAFCSPPDAPDSPPTYQRPSKPITPYCVDTFRVLMPVMIGKLIPITMP